MSEPKERTPIEDVADRLYQRAVAMHGSISGGRGAVGWDDREVLRILSEFARRTVEEACSAVCPRHTKQGRIPILHSHECMAIRRALGGAEPGSKE